MRSVLVVGAHPDDETMLAGGTIALLAEYGVDVHIMCATRGEGGERGDPPVCEQHELGAAREEELRCAAQALGVTDTRLMGYVDPVIGPDEELFPFVADFDTLIGQIKQAADDTGADVILTHGSDGEYGHPAHKLLHRAVHTAAGQTLLYTFAAFVPSIEDRIWNQHDPAHLALDVSPWLDAKEAAATCHVSQHALFKRRSKATNIRDVLRTTESFHRHNPAVNGNILDDDFARLLLESGAWIPDHTG